MISIRKECIIQGVNSSNLYNMGLAIRNRTLYIKRTPVMIFAILWTISSQRLYNVALTSMQRHDVASILMRRCIKAGTNRYYYTTFFISYPISVRDSNISPRAEESRANMGY